MVKFFSPLIWGIVSNLLQTRSFLISDNGELASWEKFFVSVFLMVFTPGFTLYILIDETKRIYLDDWISHPRFIRLLTKQDVV